MMFNTVREKRTVGTRLKEHKRFCRITLAACSSVVSNHGFQNRLKTQFVEDRSWAIRDRDTCPDLGEIVLGLIQIDH